MYNFFFNKINPFWLFFFFLKFISARGLWGRESGVCGAEDLGSVGPRIWDLWGKEFGVCGAKDFGILGADFGILGADFGVCGAKDLGSVGSVGPRGFGIYGAEFGV